LTASIVDDAQELELTVEDEATVRKSDLPELLQGRLETTGHLQ